MTRSWTVLLIGILVLSASAPSRAWPAQQDPQNDIPPVMMQAHIPGLQGRGHPRRDDRLAPEFRGQERHQSGSP